MEAADLLRRLVPADDLGLSGRDHPARVDEVEALGELGRGRVVHREDGAQGQDEPGLRLQVPAGREVRQLVLLGAAAGQGQPVPVDGVDEEDGELVRLVGVFK